MYHKHDQISIHRNPLREYSTPLKEKSTKVPNIIRSAFISNANEKLTDEDFSDII